MDRLLTPLLCFLFIKSAAFTDPGCVIELECAECVPDNMPLVTSHRAAHGSVAVAHGDELVLTCGAGAFLLYPRRTALSARCDQGLLQVLHDGTLRHLLDLGCQESLFEDVLHDVEHCEPPLQGRAYRLRESAAGVRHLAVVCFDADRGVARWARATSAPHNELALPPHSDAAAPLSLLGNFGHMFDARTRADAEHLYSDDGRLTRRLHELLRHERVSFGEQSLTSAALLAPDYFEDQNARAAEFVSNRVALWRGVAAGNLRHLRADVRRALSRRRLHVLAGTHGVLSARVVQGARPELYLRGGRFPVPRYVWTVVVDAARRRALALVLLNDPLVAVSEIRETVFCESACGGAGWLQALRRRRQYEVPALGLVFCCSVHELAAAGVVVPPDVLRAVPPGRTGMLLDDIDTDTDHTPKRNDTTANYL